MSSDYSVPELGAVSAALRGQLESHVLFQPKCLCILSIWPFFSLFAAFLKALFRVSCLSLSSSSLLSAGGLSSADNRPPPMLAFPLPLERYIVNFIAEIPVPPPGLLRLRCVLPDSTLVSYARPPHNRLPLCDSDYRCLFRVLDCESVVRVWGHLCCEHKVLLVSSSYSLLTTVAECLTSLLFPFFWSSIYMPFVPEQMLDFLQAPVPFLSGVHEAVTERAGFFYPDDAVIVYLDRSELHVPETVEAVPLGEKDTRKLLQHLRRYASLSSKVCDVDINVSDWAFPHGEDLQPIVLDETDLLRSRPGTPVSSVNSNINSPRSPSPPSTSPSASHTRSQSGIASASFSLPQTPSKVTGTAAFSFNTPTSSTPSTPSGGGATSPTFQYGNGAIPMRRLQSAPGQPNPSASSSSSLLSFGSSHSGFSVDQIRYGFLRVFVKLMQHYRKYMPSPAVSPLSSAAAGAAPPADEQSASRVDGQGDDGSDPSHPASGRKREWLNVDRFVSETSASLRPFCAAFVQTQMFARFIDDRIAVDLERREQELKRAESDAAFLRSRGVRERDVQQAAGERKEAREPPASVLKAAAELGIGKKEGRAVLHRFPAAWRDHESALDFLLSYSAFSRERDAAERAEWETGHKLRSLFDLDTDPTMMKTHDQILLMDEAIAAKHNRNVAARLASHALPTPFLSDTSSHLFVPFIPASPSYLGSGEDEHFLPCCDEDGSVIFPVLEAGRWGDRKVSDLIWMEGGERGRRWEAKMSEKRRLIERLKEEERREREAAERKLREKEGGNFVTRLWKGKQQDGDRAAAAAAAQKEEQADSLELYLSPCCGLQVEGRKKQLIARAGDRSGLGELRSPRTLLAWQQSQSLLPIRSLAAEADSADQPELQDSRESKATVTHQRSFSSQAILLSSGPPLSSLPVLLNATGQAGTGRLNKSDTDRRTAAVTAARPQPPAWRDTAESGGRSDDRLPTVGSYSGQRDGSGPLGGRRVSASRSLSEAETITFHITSTPVTQAADAPSHAELTALRSSPPPPPAALTGPAQPAPPPIPPTLPSAAPSSALSSSLLRKSPPPVPVKPVVRPALAASLSMPSATATASQQPLQQHRPPTLLSLLQPASIAAAPAPPPLSVLMSAPAPSAAGAASGSVSSPVAFVIHPRPIITRLESTSESGRRRSGSRSASPSVYTTPMQGPDSARLPTSESPSPQPLTPLTPNARLSSGDGRDIIMRTTAVPGASVRLRGHSAGAASSSPLSAGSKGEEKKERQQAQQLQQLQQTAAVLGHS